MCFVTGTLKIILIKLQTINTCIWSGLQKYLQIFLTFANNFVFTYCTSLVHLNFLNIFLHRKEC